MNIHNSHKQYFKLQTAKTNRSMISQEHDQDSTRARVSDRDCYFGHIILSRYAQKSYNANFESCVLGKVIWVDDGIMRS